MKIVRPMGLKDLDALVQLVLGSGHGLTSLPKDPDVLRERLKKAGKGKDYLFALEDLDSDEIVGVSGLYSKTGGSGPLYLYEIRQERRESKELGVDNVVKTLHPKVLRNGPSELCSLYLHPKHRKSNKGRFLSLVRFLFIADNRKSFESEIMAEMRGMVGEDGTNPFWSAVGAKFFKIEFTHADYLYMLSKRWVRELLPEFPICINLLPPNAQFVIGKVHPNTVPALKILQAEGLSDSGLVSVLEPGPILTAKMSKIRSIQQSMVGKVAEITRGATRREEHMISNRKSRAFRACLGQVRKLGRGVAISREVSEALRLKRGDGIRYITLKA